ncbi:lamin tail domain-containing protein [candidate division WOR-3 bacterium]|nr:lamin tail domain-containing protein [candidate division WOR-3 bacterium]
MLCSETLVAEQIVINEVMANPRGSESVQGSPGDRNEFIELFNDSSDPYDISKLLISDGDATDVIIAWNDTSLMAQNVIWGSTILQPGNFAVILDPEYTDSGDQTFYQPYRFGDGTLIVTVGNTTLGNGLATSDPVLLLDSSLIVISTYGTPWDSLDSVPFDPGDGVSSERINPSVEDSDRAWRPSADSCTPGKINSVYCGNLVIDPEFMRFSGTTPGEPCTLTVRLENLGSDTVGGFSVVAFRTKYIFYSDSLIFSGETAYSRDLFPGYADSVALVWLDPPAGLFTLFVRALDAEASKLVRFGHVPGQLIISEVMFAPDCSGEWIELRNRYDRSCSVQCLLLSGKDTAFAEIIVDQYGYLVLCEDSASFRTQYTAFQGLLFQPKIWPVLGNFDDSILVLEPLGTKIDALKYSFTSWERGFSLERVCDEISSDDPGNWARCVSPAKATPGAKNSVQSVLPDLEGAISVTPNPFSPDGDMVDENCIIAVSLGTYPENMKLKIFDISGSVLRTFESFIPEMTQYFIWDGRDDSGNNLPPGIYVLLLNAKLADGRSFSSKCTVVIAEKL